MTKIKLIIWMFVISLLVFAANVDALTCNIIEYGNHNWTWEFNNKGHGKVSGDAAGTIMHTPSNTAVFNYSSNGTKGNQVFSIPDQGTAGLAANTSNVWITRGSLRLIREYDYAGNSMSHDIDYLGGSTCGVCAPDISLEPNSSNLWFIGRSAGGKGKIYRYDVRTANTDFMFNSGSNGTVGIHVDGERIYVSNDTHIRQLDYGGNVICDFAHGLIGLPTNTGYLSGNSSTLLFSAVGDASGNLVTFDINSHGIKANDTYLQTELSNFSVWITNGVIDFNLTTTTGIITLNDLPDTTYNFTFYSNQNNGYFSKKYTNASFVDNRFTGQLYQSILYINASEISSGNQILNFNITLPLKSNVSNSTGWATFFLSSGNHNYSIDADGYMTTGGNLSISALETKFFTVEFGTANLTVKAFTLDGTVINDFNSTINLSNRIERQETNDGSTVFKTIAGTYSVTMDSKNFALDSKLITITASDRFPNVSFYLFTKNSINITIFDEETNKIIDSLTSTLVFDQELLTFTNTTADGTFFIDNLLDGLWSILASTSKHFQRNYFFTVSPQSHTFLNIYLLNTSNGEEKIFNIKNKKDQAISGALITVSNKINSSYVTVAQKSSDFGGQANIFLKSTNEYRFTINADGFTTKVFDLEPIQTDYNIILSSTEEISFTTIFEDISYLIIPDNNVINQSEELNFSIIVSSSTGSLSYFGLNSSFNNTDRKTNVTGSPSGGTASITINLTNQSGSSVPIDYFIKINGQDEIRIHRDYYVTRVITPGNYSAINFADKYREEFTAIMKAVIVVFAAVAIILTFAEVGVPAGISGMAGVFVMMGGAIINWIPRISVFILAVIIFGMFILRRGD